MKTTDLLKKNNISPSKLYGDIIKEFGNEVSIEIETEILKYIEENTIKYKNIEPFDTPIDYQMNINGITDYELKNIQSVIDNMDIVMTTPTVVNGAIMPDACPTSKGCIPVGGVVVTKNAIHPNMHSADVCCSVMLTNLGKISPKFVLDEAHKHTHFGFGGRDEFSELPLSLKNDISNNKFLNTQKIKNMSVLHLGTQGDGNHFLFVGTSNITGDTMLITHHGSRGVGANLYKNGMSVAEKYRKKLSPNTPKQNAWIPYDTEDGKEYWNALQIVRKWTHLNHSVLHDAICKAVNIIPKDRFWNEHNFVFKKGNLFYHAKGSTPLDNDFVQDGSNEFRIIPLNMSEPVLIVKGDVTKNNIGFAPHGAGRNMSRSAHKKLFENMSNEDIFKKETKGLDVRFFSNEIDISELPSAYKNADEVQKQMSEFHLGEIVEKVMPYGCIMAGHIKKYWEK